MQRWTRQCLLALLLVASAVGALAQGYPVKPVRVLVTFAAGGAVDVLGRIMAQQLSNTLGQPFIVENRPGAGGLVALEAAAKSAPDGYTLVVGSGGPLTISPSLYRIAASIRSRSSIRSSGSATRRS